MPLHKMWVSARCALGVRRAVLGTACAMACLSTARAAVLEYTPPVKNFRAAAYGASGVTLDSSGRESLQAVSHVESNVPFSFDGLNVNTFLGAQRFYDAGYNGGGVRVANVEAGHVWNGHQDLGHTQYILAAPGAVGASEYDRHATWVGSHIGGRGAGAYLSATDEHRWGIAPGADLHSGAIATSWVAPAYSTSFNVTDATVATTYSRALGGFLGGLDTNGLRADVVNSSWGYNEPTGRNIYAAGVDALIDFSGGVAVFSAGNSGPGANTVGGVGAGYNALTVGALGGANTYNTVASFSSRSPNDWVLMIDETTAVTISGARARVDISAPGQNLMASVYGGTTGGNTGGANTPGNNLYSVVAGTSFAAPIVAGGAALLVDAGKDLYAGDPNAIDGRVVKAVLLNAADKTAGWSNALVNNAGVLTTTQSLDYNVGAGRMNLDRAFDQYVPTSSGGLAGTTNLPDTLNLNSTLGTVASVGWDFATIGQGLSNFYFINEQLLGGSNFTATLSWFVERTFADANNFAGVAEVHFADLDLFVFQFDDLLNRNFLGTIAASISEANTTEHLHFTLPSTGYYGIGVNYFGDNWDFANRDSEDYGLAWFGSAAPIVNAGVPEPSTWILLTGVALAVSAHRLRRVRRAEGDNA